MFSQVFTAVYLKSEYFNNDVCFHFFFKNFRMIYFRKTKKKKSLKFILIVNLLARQAMTIAAIIHKTCAATYTNKKT